MRRTLVAVSATFLASSLAACGGGDGGDGEPSGYQRADVEFRQVALGDAPDVQAVVDASDAFGLDLLAAADPAENLVISPASAVIALAMLGEGATNVGAEELDALLGSSGDARTEAVNALAGVLAAYDGDPGSVDDEDLPESPLVHVANNVVLDDQADVTAAYLARLAEFYDAGVQVADLGSDAGTKVLDVWVREHTGGRIEKSAITPSGDLRLVLQDAVLLAARWQQEFDPGATREGEFTTADRGVQPVDLMTTLQPLAYAESDGWQAVELPYRDGFAVARLVLPPEGEDPAAIPATTLAALEDGLQRAGTLQVQLSLPRFEVDSTTNLTEVLKALGVQAIFDPGAGALEGIGPGQELHVGQAVQQATITVGEQGTVAAAVTEIGVAGTAAPVVDVVFVADRPFLMVVEEATTGWDLFQTVVRTFD